LKLRTSGNQHPTNVLKYDFDYCGRGSPQVPSLCILILFGTTSSVNGKSEKYASTLVKDNGIYTVPYGTHITASGTLGLSVEVFDYLNGVSNRCGVYSLEFFLDNELIYSHVMDEFSFSETRYANARMDYQERIHSGTITHRLYRLPNDRLHIYNKQLSNDPIELKENKVYKLRIVASDVNGNKSELSFQITGDQNVPTEKQYPPGFVKTMKYNVTNKYAHNEVVVEIPPYALYEDLDFTYNEFPGPPGALTKFFQIASAGVPIYIPFTLSIRTSVSDPSLQEKLLLVYLNNDNEIEGAGGEFDNGEVTAHPRSFGKYAISLDTVAPEIISMDGILRGDISGRKAVRFTILDNLSGIDRYDGYIDNKWALFEYDLKNDMLTYTFDDERMNNNSDHELELYVSDEKGNVSLFHTKFTW